jgi:putative Mg2+ transporter-C (MgtC) family protein
MAGKNMQITEFDIILRLCLGFIAGAVIGFERSSGHQVAGLRTHILIAIGATLLMILSIWLPQQFPDANRGDAGRIAAQVVSGIGFLGAGAIIRLGNNIRGLTTAASLWLIAAVGLAVGAGLFLAAAVAEALTLVALIALGHFEKRFFPSERNKLMELSYKHEDPDIKNTLDIMKSFGVRVQSIDVNQMVGKAGKIKGSKLRLLAGIPLSADMAELTQALKDTGIDKVEITEKY